VHQAREDPRSPRVLERSQYRCKPRLQLSRSRLTYLRQGIGEGKDLTWGKRELFLALAERSFRPEVDDTAKSFSPLILLPGSSPRIQGSQPGLRSLVTDASEIREAAEECATGFARDG
jgi:hypothetical protein